MALNAVPAGKWACSVCTFFNPMSSAKCQMCASPKFAPHGQASAGGAGAAAAAEPVPELVKATFSRSRAPTVSLPHRLPFEVLQYTMTFLPPKDIATFSCASITCRDTCEHDDLWWLMLERDCKHTMDTAIVKHKGRRLKDVYEMVVTGQYVEVRFEDRSPVQKVLIVVGSILLSPILVIYLMPRIIRGIWRNAIQPTVAHWTHEKRPSPVSGAAAPPSGLSWSDKEKQRRDAAAGKAPLEYVPFFQRPLWQQLVIALLSVLFSPYLLWHHRRRIWRAIVLVLATILDMSFKIFVRPPVLAVKFLLGAVAMGLMWLRRRLLVPAAQLFCVAAKVSYERVVVPQLLRLSNSYSRRSKSRSRSKM